MINLGKKMSLQSMLDQSGSRRTSFRFNATASDMNS